MLETLISNVDNIIFSFVQGTFGSLSPTINILWRLMFIIFIAVFGYKVIISGRFSAPELIKNTLKIIVLLIIATDWDTFLLVVYNLTTDLPSDIAGLLIQNVDGATTTSVATDESGANEVLSRFYDRSMAISEKILEGAGWTKWGLYFYGILIWIGTLAFTGFAAMLIILAKLAVAVLLAIGPLFILLLIFSNAKALFEGWLRTLLNYAIIPVFVYALLALMLAVAEWPLRYLEANSGPSDALLTSIAPFLFTCIVAMLILAQILNIAASVTSGLSLSTMGSGAWAGRTSGTLAKRFPKLAAKGSIVSGSAIRHPIKTTAAARSGLATAIKNTRGF